MGFLKEETTEDTAHLLAHSLVLSWLAFLYGPGPPVKGMVLPAVGWTFLYQLTIKTTPHPPRCVLDLSDLGTLPRETPFSGGYVARLCQGHSPSLSRT